jgi:hypothetical protein
VSAPWKADGPPDPIIGQIYNNQEYYQWYYRHDHPDGTVDFEGLEESIQFLVNCIKLQGPFDGILGFSQGAAMATLLTDRLLQDSNQTKKPKFTVLIGGIQPMQIYAPQV